MPRDEADEVFKPERRLTPDALLMARVDGAGRVRAAGERFRAVLDRDWSEILGAPIQSFITGGPQAARAHLRRLTQDLCGCDYVRIGDAQTRRRMAFAIAAPCADGAVFFFVRPTTAVTRGAALFSLDDPRLEMANAAASELTGRNLARGRANSPQSAKAILLLRAAATLCAHARGRQLAKAAHEAMISHAAAEISTRAALRFAETPPETDEIDREAEAERLAGIAVKARSAGKIQFQDAAAAASQIGEETGLSPEERAASDAARAHGSWLSRNG